MPDRPSSGDDDRYSWLSKPPDKRRPDETDEPAYDPDATQVVKQPADDGDKTQMIPMAAQGPSEPRTKPVQGQSGSSLPPMQMPPAGAGGSSGGRTPKPARSSGGGRSKGKIIRRGILAIVLVWLLFLIAVPIWAWSKIDKVDAEPDGSRPDDQPGTTYLLVGSDSRAGLSEEQRQELSTGTADGQRTDTIMLLHTGDGAPLLMSIPRDSEVEIPGQGTSKINAAFAAGGPQLLVQTIEQDTGIYVDDYVEIGFGGFANIVDALGGVQICPTQDIKDKRTQLDLKEGCQEADGKTALGFARTRYEFADSDLTRVQNQRQVLGSIGDEAVSPWTIVNPLRYLHMADAGASSVTIGDNVGPVSLAKFAWALAHVTGGGGNTCTMPITDGSATQWDPERSKALFQLFIEDRTDDVTKTICTKTGLAP